MLWREIGYTFEFMIIGYLIGSLSNAIIMGKIFKLDDIRKKGSGNAGATNILRNYGVKIALLVFVLDVLKPIVAMLIALPWKNNVFIPAIGLATIIGHIWPIYFKFKGGKGAASFLGFIIILHWAIAIIGFFIFMAIVLKSKIVSLGSLLTTLILLFIYILFAYIPGMRQPWFEPLTHQYLWWNNIIVFIVIWLIMLYKHKGNIKRMMSGTENKLK